MGVIHGFGLALVLVHPFGNPVHRQLWPQAFPSPRVHRDHGGGIGVRSEWGFVGCLGNASCSKHVMRR